MQSFIILFVSVMVLSLCHGQTYDDWIVTTSGDTTHCRITMVNQDNLFYWYRQKKSEKSTYVSLNSVREYFRNGVVKQPYTENDAVGNTEREAAKQLQRQSAANQKRPESVNMMAGQTLQRASSMMLGGIAISFVGTTMGSYFIGQDEPQLGGVIMIASGFIGGVLTVAGVAQIGKAGRLLKSGNTSLHIQGNHDGLGLALRFWGKPDCCNYWYLSEHRSRTTTGGVGGVKTCERGNITTLV